MARFCAQCGTEVDDVAAFCPTCGHPIDRTADTEMPPAPTWPEDEPDEPADDAAPPPADDQPTRVEERPDPAVERRSVVRPTPPDARTSGGGSRPGAGQVNVPVTWPVTLSAWLMGVGSAVAALGVLVGLFDGVVNPIDLLLMLVFIGVAATIFFATSMPAVPHLRLATMAVALIGFGIALDRIGFGGAGIGELLMFLGTAAAAIGAILVEIGQDQPLGGPSQ